MAEQFPEGNTRSRYEEGASEVAGQPGAVVAALGAAGVAASAYLEWFDDMTPQDMPFERLFQTEISGDASSYWTSVAAPLAVVGVIGLIGLLLRSRLVFTVAGLVGLATLVLWIVMTAIDISPNDLEAADYQPGVWVCAASLVILLIGIIGMGRRYPREEFPPDEAVDYDEEPPRPADF